ncbi:PHP C-terminal domain protein [Desulforamulus reducens MI-1]|uniref:protein-tyrosine-phosphatase n=1 Tax=Desulforamulus reducens (strain ATCC BAA-1160 / DSM 100696 / MI-1) TaxID=349161 RepID=A4J8U7_DESRM|nr:CpsB/CapC family capsule biosynthesis tyrosine phosphatase [Desulforamulus reducens]ABO51500.1 PHP C-terminal domain protein [Desulforamulus reducens MI-1]
MIDLHCHILPNIDDGAKDQAISLEMAAKAVQEGITTIIATPHCIPEVYFTERQAILSAVAELQKLLDGAGLPLKILPGMEVHLTLDAAQRLAQGSALTLNDTGKYVLLEFPMNHVPAYSGQVIFEIMLKGIKPILAHPERNREIIESPQVLYQLQEKGCLVQVTAGSLTGRFGSKIQQLTQDFVRLGWVDFIASDAHDPIKRPFLLREARLVVEELVGRERALQLVLGNPEKVTKGEAIGKGEVLPYQLTRGEKRKKKGLWYGLQSFFRK